MVLNPNLSRSESIGRGGNKQWSATFPEQFEELSDADKFMERCLIIGVSQILQSRKLLPEKTFKKRAISDICRCYAPDAKQFIGARLMEKVRGAAEAMRHGYLKEFIIVVSTNDDNHHEAIEVFTWSVAYSDDKVVSTFSAGVHNALMSLEYTGPDSVKKQTIDLLLRIRKLCHDVLQRLPDGAFPTFRITYTNGTPKGYQAPGFYRSPQLYDLDPKARCMTVSGVANPHYKTVLCVKSICLDDEFAAEQMLNYSLDMNESILSTSFGTIHNLNETLSLEQPRATPVIAIGEPINNKNKKRPVRGEKKPVVPPKRKQIEEAEPNRGNTPVADSPSPAEEIFKTPGKSFKLDQISPDRKSR